MPLIVAHQNHLVASLIEIVAHRHVARLYVARLPILDQIAFLLLIAKR